MLIRQATPSDAQQLMRLNQHFNGTNNQLTAVQAALSKHASETVFVSESGGKLVGFAALQTLRSFCYAQAGAELSELFVLPTFRRRGFAAGLFNAIINFCQHNDVSELSLCVSKNNLAAKHFYQSQGCSLQQHRCMFCLTPSLPNTTPNSKTSNKTPWQKLQTVSSSQASK